MIAPSGTSPNPAEVENARIGADGTVYSTLGESIRTQINNIDNTTDIINDIIYRDLTEPNENLFDKRYLMSHTAINSNNGKLFTTSLDYSTTNFIPVEPSTRYSMVFVNETHSVTSDFAMHEYSSNDENTWIKKNTSYFNFTTTVNTHYVRFYINDSDINVAIFSRIGYAQDVNGSTEYVESKRVVSEKSIKPLSISDNSISDNSISNYKLKCIRKEGNLFDKDTITDNAYINGDRGSLFTIEGYYVSDFILVYQDECYIAELSEGIWLYNEYKEYIGIAPSQPFYITGNYSNVKYIRVCFKHTKVTPDKAIIQSGIMPTVNPDYTYDCLDDNIKIQPASIKDTILRKSPNLFNKNTAKLNWYLLDNGGLIKADNYFVSDYIEVKGSTTYYVPCCERMCFYNTNKGVISAQTSIWGNVTTPANTKYVRFTYKIIVSGIYGDYNWLNDNFLVEATSNNDAERFYNHDEYSLKPKRVKLYTLADAWQHWSVGVKFPIGILGDSTTDGANTTHGATHETEDTNVGGFGLVDYINTDAYCYKLQTLIREELNNPNMRVYNIGYSGTRYLWARPKYDDIFGHVYSDVKMVGLTYGINDRVGMGTSYKYYNEFRNHLIHTIDYLYDKGIQPFFITTQATIEPYTRSDMTAELTRTSYHIKTVADRVMFDLAKEYDIEIIDMNSFDEYILTTSSHSAADFISDTLHFTDLGHTYEAGFLFYSLNPRVIEVTNECTLSFANQMVKSEVWSNRMSLVKTGKFNCKCNYTQDDDSDILLQDFWIYNKTGKPLNITAICDQVISQRVYIDDGSAISITSINQSLGNIDVGIHHIVAKKGISTAVVWTGFDLTF